MSVSLLTVTAQQKQIQIDGWNAYVHVPEGYNHDNKHYPTLIFIPGLGEIGSDARKVIQHGPGAYLKQGWNGEVLGVKFIIISLQPTSAWPGIHTIKQRIDKLKEQYRIGNIWMTGLSMGGWASLWYSYAYPAEIKGLVGVQSVVPSEGEGNDYEKRILETYRIPAQAGQRYLLYEQKNDWRRNDQVASAMNYWKPGSGVYVYTTFNGGGHCCWNEFYGGQGKEPGKFNIDGIEQNLYEWIAHDILRVLPVFITSIYIRDRVLSWSAENLQPGDYFLIEESRDGSNFREVSRVPVTDKPYYQYPLT